MLTAILTGFINYEYHKRKRMLVCWSILSVPHAYLLCLNNLYVLFQFILVQENRCGSRAGMVVILMKLIVEKRSVRVRPFSHVLEDVNVQLQAWYFWQEMEDVYTHFLNVTVSIYNLDGLANDSQNTLLWFKCFVVMLDVHYRINISLQFVRMDPMV